MRVFFSFCYILRGFCNGMQFTKRLFAYDKLLTDVALNHKELKIYAFITKHSSYDMHKSTINC